MGAAAIQEARNERRRGRVCAAGGGAEVPQVQLLQRQILLLQQLQHVAATQPLQELSSQLDPWRVPSKRPHRRCRSQEEQALLITVDQIKLH
jgi:hypothetical protein